MSKRQAHPRSSNLRRSFRSDRMTALYLRALGLGWVAKVQGSGHVAMHAPDGKTVMVLSTTSKDRSGSAVRNNESVLKRWLKGDQS